MSNRPNLGWIFYRKAFDFNFDNFFDNNEYKGDIEKHTKKVRAELTGANEDEQSIFETTYKTEIQQLLNNPHSNTQFDLVTTYPGLLIGSGYNHEVGLEEEFKLGFYFDHTTGLPVIPGSSVKGALRQVFPGTAKDNKDRTNKVEFLRWMLRKTNERIERINEQDSETTIPFFDAEEIELKELEQQMFKGSKLNEDKQPAIPMHQRDVFYDAYPVESVLEKTQKDSNYLLGSDYITPHKHDNPSKAHLDALAEPTPIQFLKVLPGVKFRFQFKLQESPMGISRLQKEILFRHILLTLGIGAKTNVGFGQFMPQEEYKKLFNQG